MKLYYSPGACSLAPHIALVEAGLPHTTARVDLRAHTLAGGADFYAINSKGYVPVLELDNGERLTEVAVILQYIADRKPGTLAPEAGTFERYRQIEWLNFIATELHKGFGPLWKPDTPEAYKAIIVTNLGKRFDFLERTLKAQSYLGGQAFTVADAYLFTILNWAGMLKVDLAKWPALTQYLDRVRARPKVQETLRAEHLLKAETAAAD